MAAMQFARAYVRVVPLERRTQPPLDPGLVGEPIGAGAQVAEVWTDWPEENLAIHARRSGIAVVNVNGPEGEGLLEKVCPKAWTTPTPVVKTPGGYHIWFRDPGTLIRSAHGGLDLIAGNALVIV